jgi:hypothetical protein
MTKYYFYAIKIREFHNVFKIGVKKNNIYSAKTNLLFHSIIEINDDKRIIEILNRKYKKRPDIGLNYYEGDFVLERHILSFDKIIYLSATLILGLLLLICFEEREKFYFYAIHIYSYTKLILEIIKKEIIKRNNNINNYVTSMLCLFIEKCKSFCNDIKCEF